MRMLTEEAKIVRHSNAVAAGTSDISPTNGIDTQGFGAVQFEVSFGAIVATGVQSIKAQQSTVIDGTGDTFADVAGTNVTVADSDDNKVFWLDVRNPQERFVRCVVLRATANATLDGITAHLYEPTTMPVTHDATTVGGGERHVSPIAGTA